MGVKRPVDLLVVVGLILMGACASAPTATSSPPTSVPASTGTTGIKVLSSRYAVATPHRDGALAVFEAPDLNSPQRALDHPRHPAGNPQALVPLVLLALERRSGWVKVSLPVRPNGSTGWVRDGDVDLLGHDYRIDVDLAGFRLRLLRRDTTVFEAPIAVATEDAPTPGGMYYTTELLQADPAGLYGPYAYGLSGHSDTYTTFGAGDGQLGIHGTDHPELMGTKVSHGCIRMRNEDITALVGLGLPLGVPVTVR